MASITTIKPDTADRSNRRIADTNGLLEHWDHPFSKAQLEKWRHIGGGPPFLKVGRAVRYDLDQADAWLDKHMKTKS